MEKHIPVWQATGSQAQNYPQLSKDIKSEIVIIGGGITGLTAANKLIAYNKDICIIEAGKIGRGTTGYSTGNLYVPIQSLFSTIASKFDKQTVKTIIESRLYSLAYIEQITKEYGIDCNFIKRPLYLHTNDKKQVKKLQDELELLKENGLEASIVNDLPIPVSFVFAIKIENQARFNPSAYMDKLACNLTSHGCKIFEESPVVNIQEFHDHCRIETKNGVVTANQVLVTTHIPKGINRLQLVSFPYRSYAVAFSLKDKKYSNVNCWDMDPPYYATSTHNIFSKDIDTIIVAGNNHKTGQPLLKEHIDHFITTEQHIKRHYDIDVIKATWSAQHYKTADNIPYVGLASRNAKRIYTATGYATDGLIYGTVAGIILGDIVRGKTNPWASVYNSNRFTPIASFTHFMKENLNVFLHYLLGYMGSIFNRGLNKIKRGQGKVMNIKSKKVAVYRNQDGKLTAVSAVCPHMKCIVAWNGAEKSWDCPCHGSRFTVDGSIIEGPAFDPLHKITP